MANIIFDFERHEEIPPMTHPLSKAWDQPPLNEFVIDKTHCLMTEKTYKQLHNYEYTLPTGKYEGKVFRRGNRFTWFSEHVNPGLLMINYREILIID